MSTANTSANAPTEIPIKMDGTLYTDKLINQVKNFGLPWMRVGVVAHKNGDSESRYLLVREAKVKRRLPGGGTEWVPGDGGWNIPAGRINVGESMIGAAIREAREESGCDIRITGICEIAQRTTADNPYTIITFAANVRQEHGDFDREEISEIGWFTVSEIKALHERGQLRSPDLVIGAIENYRHYGTIPPCYLRMNTD